MFSIYPAVIVLSLLHSAFSYDYVVIGGGTAGLTVASRLAEDDSVQVAVIEAGANAEHRPDVFIPGMLGQIGVGTKPPELNWAYKTVPQTHLNGRVLTVNAGRALGGSTVINAMIFPRAKKEQYDAWGILNNDTSWTWEALLPFFKRSESFTVPNDFQASNGARYDPQFHGFDGSLKVGFPNYFFPQEMLWQNTSIGLGFPAATDLSNGEPHAVGPSPFSIDAINQTRCSAACAFYTPFADRPNFTIITNANVTRIIWSESENNSSLAATGVEYVTNNETMTLEVTGEVILSAGTIGSPKILELSGIGNSTILRAAGVEPLLDLPTVGENLAGMYAAVSKTLGITAPLDVVSQSQLDTLLTQAESNLSHYASQFSNGNPDLARGIEAQHRLAFSLYQENQQLCVELNLDAGYVGPTPLESRPLRNFTTVSTILYAPLARGRSHISSSDPFTVPLVDPAYWAHPMDVAIHVGGIQLAKKMLRSPPLDSIYDGEFEPGVESDKEIENWLRGNVTSDNHVTGTLSMLPRELGGVVDTQLKVYGTMNVRVVDASVIPFPVSAHTSSTVYMIGERAADIIRKSRGN
ncbi:glucose oxidase [Moniliophthora roreri MCA 2997]|uniref:Glucose oxidase n=1 Tax=Moniliophthora roreri (strain MCA 2997) TaxID=1381753 RepID=V2WWG3_MONRO|nr:glucose oxidase [Moniliophthora roreri MCA 2997]